MADVSMDTVHIEIESTMKDSTSSIDTLITKLNNLKTSISNVVKESQKLTEFRNNIKSTSSIPNIKTSGGSSKGRTPTAPKAPFAEYGSLQSQLKALDVDLDTSKAVSSIKTLNSEITKYKTNTGQLVTVNKKVKNGLEGTKVSVKNLNNEVKKGNSIWSAFTTGLSGTITKLGILYTGFRSIVSKLGDFVDQAATYEEALNLFTVTMGEYAKEGVAWVEKFSNALFLDPTNVMQYMGSFNSLIKGLGVGAERSYIMSQNLTQLVYDLASFKNLSFEEAFLKIQSAISGEIEPLRNVGVALSQNTLQELANSLGIEKRVAEMSEAEKAQLRYIQILKSTGEWQTDMGRTLITPANSLRVLREQFTLLAKAVGQVFIPILMAALPYVMVLTQALTELAKRIANFLGYEIADIDYGNSFDSVIDGITGVGDAADDTAKKLNTMLAPFDELNVVQNKSKSSGDGIGNIGGDLGVDIPIYDALANLSKELEEKMGKAKEQLKEILPIIEAIGVALLSWKISSSVLDFLSKWGMTDVKTLSKLAGLTLIIGSLALDFKSLGKLYDPNSTDDEFSKALLANLGSTVGVAAGTFLLTKNVTLTLAVTAIKLIFDVGFGLDELLALNPTFKEIMGGLGFAFTELFSLGDLSGVFSGLFGGLSNALAPTILEFTTFISNIGMDISRFINGISIKLMSFVGTIGLWVNTVSEFIGSLPQKFVETFEEIKTKISEKFEEVKDKVTQKIEEIRTKIENLPGQISGYISSIPGKFQETFNNAKDKVMVKLKELKTKIGNKIIKPIENSFSGLGDNISNIFKTMANVIIGVFNAVIKALNVVIKGLNKISVTVPGWINFLLGNGNKETKWGFNLKELKEIEKFEIGGYPTKGDLFYANENGIPEMVGRIGNQTAVANNDQIETSLTNALLYALDKNGGNKNPSTIVVNIGNRKVYEGVGEHIDGENDRYGTDYVTV